METLRKVLGFLGIFAVLIGVNFWGAHADVPGTYYGFYLDNNGGSGGTVVNNSIYGTLRYGTAWGYMDAGQQFVPLTSINTLPTHTSHHIHFSGYRVNSIRVINSNGAFITSNEALTSFNTANTALVAEWSPNNYHIALEDEGGSGSQVASNSTWSLFEKYGACYVAAQSFNTDELESAVCITNIYRVPSKSGYTFDGYYTGKNGTGNKIIDSGGTIVGSYTEFTSDSEIYANWIPVSLCAGNIIELNTGGGATSCSTTWHPVPDSQYSSGFATPAIVSSAETSCVPTKAGCTFLGYWEEESGDQYYDSALNILIPEWNLCKIEKVELVARWSCSTPIPCGYYIPANSTTYTECPEGYYCTGGDFFVPANYDQGIYECAKTCSGATSDAGACSVTECYEKCDMNCYKPNTNCPTNDSQCEYGAANAPGAAYLLSDGSCGTCDYMYQPASGNPINFCPVTSCPANYYFTTNSCAGCLDGYTAPAGSTSPQQCTKNCEIPCNQPTCPAGVLAHGHCEYGHEVGVGVMNQVDQICQGVAPTCSVTYVCGTGYELNLTGDACVAKDYTVTYKCESGAGANTTDTVTYGQSYTVLNQNDTTCEKPGYYFNGWLFSGDNTVYAGGGTFTWSYDSNAETLTAQWGSAISYNITYHYDNTASWGTGNHPNLYTTNDLPLTIDAVMTRTHSIFVGWCDDAGLTQNCAMVRTVPTGTTGNIHFYAKWECEKPYHIGPETGQCETCPNGQYWNGTACTGCSAEFPNSTAPFNWSIDQCWRSCTNGANCVLPTSGMTQGAPGACVVRTFLNTPGTQIEFKGNHDAGITTCGENITPYCPYGLDCSSESVNMPRSVPVTFWSGSDWSNWLTKYIVGFGAWNGSSGTMVTGNIWSAIMGPAQNVSFENPDDAYSVIVYPVQTAPDAAVAGMTFNGYYNKQNGGTKYIDTDYILNTTNAQTVGVALDNNIPGNRNLYAHYENNQYNIYYQNMNNATPSATGMPSTYTYGTGAVVNGVPTKPLSEFVGWCTDSGLTDCAMAQTIGHDEYGDKTFWAKWNDVPSVYTVTYKPNYTGASQSDKIQDVTHGASFTTKPGGTFTRPGYVMVGWSEPFPLMNHSYTYNINGNTTLNAQWQICPAGTYEEGGVCKSCDDGYSSLPGATGADECFLSECPTGQHLVHGACEDDVIECSAPDASYATRTWNPTLGAYGACSVIECASGYHIASNACVIDEQTCGVTNGRGERVWDGAQWGGCQIVECDPGFENIGNACSECSNRRVAGEIAVSSYATGCEIAACMYQGQKYVLENNECRPVCETESDETGSKTWDNIRKKCVRTCNPGYKMW